MNREEHIEPAEAEERRPRFDLNIEDVILLAFIVIYVIFVPIGGIQYICGWYNAYLLFSVACIIFPIMCIFLPLFTAIWTLRPIINWTKYTQRKRFIRIIYIFILLVFVVSFFTPINIPLCQPGYKTFTYGFRERIKSKADIEDIRNWMKTLKEEDCNGEPIVLLHDSDSFKSQWPDTIEWPKSLKVFKPHYVRLELDENKSPKMSLTWGGPFAHWGVVIGMEDMEIPPSDLRRYGEYRLSLEPGVYVWHELQ